MSSANSPDYDEMVGLVLEEKQARRELQEMLEVVPKLKKQLAKARSMGRPDLEERVLQRLQEVKQDVGKAKTALEHLQDRKSMLRVGSRVRGGEQVSDASALVDSFEGLGIDVGAIEINEEAEKMMKHDMLAELKSKMNRGGNS